MANVEHIVEVKRSVEDELLSRDDVTGVDVGYKYVGGKKTDEVAIRVFVKKKKSRVSAEQKVPEKINGVKTDVIEREIVLHGLGVPIEEIQIQADTGTYDPLVGGISIGPCRSIGGFVYTGTLGAIVRDNATGNPMALSNFHVMCVDSGWSVGDAMAQPSRVDTGTCPADTIGTLARASLGGQVDCAVCTVSGRGTSCEIENIGSITGTATCTLGMSVRKRGRTTGLTHGTVDSISLTVAIDYGPSIGTMTLTNQIGINVDTAESSVFGQKGDSGSVVVDDNRRVVGLYFAGTSDGSFGVANPIDAVLTALNVSMCTWSPPTLKFLDDGGTLKFVDDGGTLKFVDDGGTLKFLDDGGTLKFADDVGTLPTLDQPGTLKAIDDVKTPALDKRFGDVKAPGSEVTRPPDLGGRFPGLPRGGTAPFVLATPHHSMAWAQRGQGTQTAQYQAVAAQYETALTQLAQLMQQSASELEMMQGQYDQLMSEYQQVLAALQQSGGQ